VIPDPAEVIPIVRNIAPETPLTRIPELNIWVKDERAMPTGSFKVRGAAVWLARGHARRAIVTASSGNHGRALHWALTATGDRRSLTIVVTAAADQDKVKALADTGCEIVTIDGNNEERDATARRLAIDRGASYCSSHDDDEVILGQGTVGTEIFSALPNVSSIFVPVCGGGLFAGILAANSHYGGGARVIGVQPSGANAMLQSLATGRKLRIDHVNTCCDALRAAAPGQRCFRIAQLCSAEVMAVSDAGILKAQRLLEHYIGPVEVSAAAGVAGALKRGAQNAVCVVTGFPLPSAISGH
jgi:threonine dehydratase